MHCLPHLTAAVKRAPPRWYVRGHTPRPSKPFVPSNKRRSLKLATFIKMGHKPIVVTIDEMAEQQQQDAGTSSSAHTSKSAWNAEVFCRIVEQKLLSHRSNRAGRRQGPVKLVLDRDSVHLNNRFQAFAKKREMKVLFLPAKAPDLDPLDYGIFGTVKQAFEKRCFSGRQRGQLSWEQQCQILIDLLEAVNPDSTIAALPSRIQKCIAARGGHFER